MSGACSTHVSDEKCIEQFRRKAWRKATTWQDFIWTGR